MTELVGKQIDNYQIEAMLGQGGMGAVYRAHDLNLARSVAIKVMHPHLTRRPHFQQQFMEEAQAVARLNHPSIVRIYRFDESDGQLYLVMELIEGPTLSAEMRRFHQARQRVNLHETLIIAAQVAEALDTAHRQGVLHQDVKPGNVMLKPLDVPDRGGDPAIRAIVTDFGLAQLLQTGQATVTGKMVGTLAYLSPEQCLEQELDGRSDIYSLGMILYEMVTGQLPFVINSATTAYHKHVHEIPPAPRLLQPNLPLAVESIIQMALAKQPQERFAEAGAMAQALRQAATQLTDEAITELPPEAAVSTIAPRPRPSAMPTMRPNLPTSQPSNGSSNGSATLPVQFVAPRPSTAAFQLTRPPIEDVAVIVRQGEQPRTAPLNKQFMTIGRADNNDIVLSDNHVSRSHLRLERSGDGWQAYNLSRTNPTVLEDSPLLYDMPERWEVGQTLQVGPYYLRWQRGGASLPISRDRDTPILITPSDNGRMGDGSIHLVVTPRQVNVKPGERATLQATLTNMGMTVDHFYLRLQGLPSSWVTIPQEITHLMPGQQSALPLTIHPPADSSADAGEHPFQMTVSGTTDLERTAVVDGKLTVAPFTQLSLSLNPSHLQNKGTCQVIIQNDGNTAVNCAIKGQDPANAVLFSGEQENLTVPHGQSKTVPLHIRPQHRRWLGSDETHNFTVVTRTDAGLEESEQGRLEVRPRIPRWLLPLLLLLIPFCAASSYFGVGYYQGIVTATATAQTATAVAANTTAEFIVTQNAMNATGTATAVQATSVALTSIAQTAQAQGDDDGDGVANFIELENQLDPNNPDTDGDGLNDGEEFYQYGTDANNIDTDEDGLTDYEEIFVCESVPTNPDTDGDGLLDGVDSHPLLLPTATSTPTLTPTATLMPTNTPLPTATATPKTQELTLALSDSGYISKTATITPTVFTSSGQDAPVALVGDGENNETYRGFLSFALSELPQDIDLVSAKLMLPSAEISGDPFATLGNLILEQVSFGSSLTPDDYEVPAQTFSTHLILHQTTIIVTDIVSETLDTDSSHLQLRLRFDSETETDMDGMEDMYRLLPDSEIKLIITYYP